ncbi:hypothetical protein BCU71_00925 [Vibrio lentus]|uniref:hypothetical protein n=1 Tax=Vibrio lentus TaxID=136468 RepID=UPI000C828C7D|nr:hypothetical protein [Vibrio lentus]PMH32147.1 hypothetical protein BCU71_00925 [Vibrio lentus]PMK71342.1 hypothetical protein BCT93_02730 [Vibrio lentus]
MSDIFDPNNPSNLLNPDVVNQRFEQIQQEELTASQEAGIKRSARELKQHAVNMNDDLNRQLRTHASNQNWDEVAKVTQQIKVVEDTIKTAADFDTAVQNRFANLETRKPKLTDEEKREIYHSYHGNDHVTQDMLASDFRKPQSTIQGIVKSDPSKFTKN